MSTTPVFIWSEVGQQETCTPVRLSWQYVGPSVTVDLSITNVDVPQPGPPGTKVIGTATSGPSFTFSNTVPQESLRAITPRQDQTSASGGNYQQMLISGVGAESRGYLVDPIVVPRDGWYQMIAGGSQNAFSIRTSSFYIWNGTDTTCYQPPTPPPTDPTSSTPGGGGSPDPTPTGTPDETPPPEESGGSSTNVGAIAGGVVGGLALLALVFVAFLFFRRRSKQKEIETAEAVGAAPPAGTSKHRKPKYGGLSSVESIDASAVLAATARSEPKHKHAGAGALAMSDRRTSRSGPSGGHSSAPFADEDEKGGSPTSPFSVEGDYTFTPEALGYYSVNSSRRPSVTHRQSGMSNMSGGVPLDPQGAISTSPTSHESPIARGDSVSPPLADVAANGKPRRKPVPSYTPSTVSGMGFAANPNAQARPPMPDAMSYQTSPASSTSGLHGGASGHNNNNDMQRWGKDGQVHYLMPDMPSPHM